MEIHNRKLLNEVSKRIINIYKCKENFVVESEKG